MCVLSLQSLALARDHYPAPKERPLHTETLSHARQTGVRSHWHLVVTNPITSPAAPLVRAARHYLLKRKASAESECWDCRRHSLATKWLWKALITRCLPQSSVQARHHASDPAFWGKGEQIYKSWYRGQGHRTGVRVPEPTVELMSMYGATALP